MEFSEVLVKENLNMCRCCLSEGCFKEINTEHYYESSFENYWQMIKECYNITLDSTIADHICESCIMKLREASGFRKLIQESQVRLSEMVEDKKIEMECVKEENFDDGNDLDDDSDYEEPLQKVRLKEKLKEAKKRGRPKKSEGDGDKTNKIVKKENAAPSKRRRKNLEILLNNTSLIPFKWRGKYLCFYCGVEYTEPSELRKHTKSHGLCHDKDYAIKLVRSSDVQVKLDVSYITCDICHETFPDLNTIITHLVTTHALMYDRTSDLTVIGYRLSDLQCLDCPKTFLHFKNLVKHVNSFHSSKSFICESCSKSFSKKRDLQCHIGNYHRNSYKCSLCNIEFDSNIKLRAHKDSSHKHMCSICLENFVSSAKKVDHIFRCHTTDGVLKCPHCDRICNTKQAFFQHITKCKFQKIVTSDLPVEASERTPKVKLIRNNLATLFNLSTALPFKFFMNRFRCFFCPKDFVYFNDLKSHSKSSHPICDIKHPSMKLRAREDVDIKIDISQLSCKVCYQDLSSFNEIIDHLISKHCAQFDKTIDCKIVSFDLSKDVYKCPYCDTSVTFFGTLLKHMNEAHSNNQLICAFCGKAFRTDPNLRAHISRHHRAATFKCDSCELVFNTGIKLKSHLARVHGRKVVKCHICDDKFTNSYLRQKHLILAHNSGATCQQCGRLFVRNSLLLEHVRRTHLKEKKVECNVCSMRFFDNFMLKMHMVRHAGDRNFHCDICGKKFLWKKNLKNHMSTHVRHIGTSS